VTAEIAILNKGAVALAADSAVTIHRDLKPANLMLVLPKGKTAKVTSNNKKLQVKIIDFGVAKALHPKPSNQSMKPTAPSRGNLSLFATTPCRGLSLSC
jgi:serine/threonine protein kinase